MSGELLIGGVGLAEGYLKRPELTAQKFRPGLRSGRAAERPSGVSVSGVSAGVQFQVVCSSFTSLGDDKSSLEESFFLLLFGAEPTGSSLRPDVFACGPQITAGHFISAVAGYTKLVA